MGSVLSKKSKLKIKNVIRKGKDMQKASATILLRNKSDINVLCFDVNIEDFYLAHFRLWPQNHPNILQLLICLLHLALLMVVMIFSETFFAYFSISDEINPQQYIFFNEINPQPNLFLVLSMK